MNILVIDGQGGQLGSQLIKTIRANYKDAKVIAVGTNATATAAMLKAGAHQASTGENPVVVACRKADVIIGPVGIVIADALFGEITPKMAVSVGQADAVRILLPVNKCDNLVAGVPDLNLSTLIEDVMVKLSLLEKQVAKFSKGC
jgi:NADPH:quinone reductase-like Zn-dependent oxidoreductase